MADDIDDKRVFKTQVKVTYELDGDEAAKCKQHNRREKLRILFGVFVWASMLTPIAIVQGTYRICGPVSYLDVDFRELCIFGIRVARWVDSRTQTVYNQRWVAEAVTPPLSDDAVALAANEEPAS